MNKRKQRRHKRFFLKAIENLSLEELELEIEATIILDELIGWDSEWEICALIQRKLFLYEKEY